MNFRAKNEAFYENKISEIFEFTRIKSRFIPQTCIHFTFGPNSINGQKHESCPSVGFFHFLSWKTWKAFFTHFVSFVVKRERVNFQATWSNLTLEMPEIPLQSRKVNFSITAMNSMPSCILETTRDILTKIIAVWISSTLWLSRRNQMGSNKNSS